MDKHFNPRYQPWDQRLCLVPDSDLFNAISKGRASVVTGEIETFMSTCIRLQSGQELEADIIVTASWIADACAGSGAHQRRWEARFIPATLSSTRERC